MHWVVCRGGPTGGSGWALAHPKPGPPGTPPGYLFSRQAQKPEGCFNFSSSPIQAHVPVPAFLAPWRLDTWLLREEFLAAAWLAGFLALAVRVVEWRVRLSVAAAARLNAQTTR